jgi:hypothetical protein
MTDEELKMDDAINAAMARADAFAAAVAAGSSPQSTASRLNAGGTGSVFPVGDAGGGFIQGAVGSPIAAWPLDLTPTPIANLLDLVPQIDFTASEGPPNGGAGDSPEAHGAQLEAQIHDQFLAGSYRLFPAMGHDIANGNWGDLWTHLTWDPMSTPESAAAARQQSALLRDGPPMTREQQRMEMGASSFFGAAASLIVAGVGGNQNAQDAALVTGYGMGQAAGGMVGTRQPGRVVGPQGPLASRPRGNAPNGLGPIIVTPKGVVVTSEVLSRQGTSPLVGDFRGLTGATVEEIVSRVPNEWSLFPQAKGAGIKFLDDQGFERIRIHGPSLAAPAGSNSASGWTLRVMDASGNYFDAQGNLVPYKANDGHIPISGNSALGPQ